MARKKRITFEEWLDKEGIRKVAKSLGVTPHTIWHWRARRSDPALKYIRKLRALSKGALSYELIIDRE